MSNADRPVTAVVLERFRDGKTAAALSLGDGFLTRAIVERLEGISVLKGDARRASNRTWELRIEGEEAVLSELLNLVWDRVYGGGSR